MDESAIHVKPWTDLQCIREQSRITRVLERVKANLRRVSVRTA